MQNKLSASFILIFSLMTFFFTGCGDNEKTNNQEPEQNQDRLVGKWECTLDAYGDPWDEPIIMLFDSDGTGYQWFSDNHFPVDGNSITWQHLQS